MLLGTKIQLLRKRKGYTQEQLARIMGVSRQSIQKWESSSTSPDISKLRELSSALEISLDDLLNPEFEIDLNKSNNPVKYEESFDYSQNDIEDVFSVFYCVQNILCNYSEIEPIMMDFKKDGNFAYCRYETEVTSNSVKFHKMWLNLKKENNYVISYEMLYSLMRNIVIRSLVESPETFEKLEPVEVILKNIDIISCGCSTAFMKALFKKDIINKEYLNNPVHSTLITNVKNIINSEMIKLGIDGSLYNLALELEQKGLLISTNGYIFKPLDSYESVFHIKELYEIKKREVFQKIRKAASVSKDNVFTNLKFIIDSFSYITNEDFVNFDICKFTNLEIVKYSFDSSDRLLISEEYLLKNGITYKMFYSIVKSLFYRKIYLDNKKYPNDNRVNKINYEDYAISYANFVCVKLFKMEFEHSSSEITSFLNNSSNSLIKFLTNFKKQLNFEIVADYSFGYLLPKYFSNNYVTSQIKTTNGVSSEPKADTKLYMSNNLMISIGSFVIFVVILLILNIVYLYRFFDGLASTVGQCVLPLIPVVLLANKKIAKKGSVICTILVFMSFSGNFYEMAAQVGYGPTDSFLTGCMYGLLITFAYMIGMYNLYVHQYGGNKNE